MLQNPNIRETNKISKVLPVHYLVLITLRLNITHLRPPPHNIHHQVQLYQRADIPLIQEIVPHV